MLAGRRAGAPFIATVHATPESAGSRPSPTIHDRWKATDGSAPATAAAATPTASGAVTAKPTTSIAACSTANGALAVGPASCATCTSRQLGASSDSTASHAPAFAALAFAALGRVDERIA